MEQTYTTRLTSWSKATKVKSQRRKLRLAPSSWIKIRCLTKSEAVNRKFWWSTKIWLQIWRNKDQRYKSYTKRLILIRQLSKVYWFSRLLWSRPHKLISTKASEVAIWIQEVECWILSLIDSINFRKTINSSQWFPRTLVFRIAVSASKDHLPIIAD